MAINGYQFEEEIGLAGGLTGQMIIDCLNQADIKHRAHGWARGSDAFIVSFPDEPTAVQGKMALAILKLSLAPKPSNH